MVSDFTADELTIAAQVLRQRYGRDVEPELADSELALEPGSNETTLCPTLYWTDRGAHFVVFRIADGRYKCQFFYSDADHYGTGRDRYDNLRECMLSLLRVQSDHERKSAGISSGATGSDLSDDYHGPPIL